MISIFRYKIIIILIIINNYFYQLNYNNNITGLVKTVFNHDKVINSSCTDYLAIENEADRVVREVKRNVELSRKQYKNPLKRKRTNNSM